MTIQYLKKSPKTSSTDDLKTREIVQNLLNDKAEYEKIAKKVNPYGDGSASTIIYNVIKRVLINNG